MKTVSCKRGLRTQGLLYHAYMKMSFERLHERKEIQYDLRTKHLCKMPIARTIKFGMESLSFRGSLLWNNLNDEIKELPTSASFKTKIKT